jgi:hypothetical protein
MSSTGSWPVAAFSFESKAAATPPNSKGELRNQREPVVGEGAVGPILNKRSDIEGNPAPLVSQQHRRPASSTSPKAGALAAVTLLSIHEVITGTMSIFPGFVTVRQ